MGKILNYYRKSAYDNVMPASYTGKMAAFINTLLNKKLMDQQAETVFDQDQKEARSKEVSQVRDDIWATYLNIPKNQRHNIPNKTTLYQTRVVDGHPEYGIAPGNKDLKTEWDNFDEYSKTDTPYEQSGITEKDWNNMIWEAFHGHNYKQPVEGYKSNRFDKQIEISQDPLKIGESLVSQQLSRFLADHAVGHGYDPEKGEYVSYGDKWDLAPFSQMYGEDETLGFGTPVHIYDRMYLDDWYGVPEDKRGYTFLPEIEVWAKKPKEKLGGKLEYLNLFNNGK